MQDDGQTDKHQDYVRKVNMTTKEAYIHRYTHKALIYNAVTLTLKPPREAVSCPAPLFLLVTLLGIRYVDRLTGWHVFMSGRRIKKKKRREIG